MWTTFVVPSRLRTSMRSMCYRRRLRWGNLRKCVGFVLVGWMAVMLLIVGSKPDYLLMPSTQLSVVKLHALPWIGLSSAYGDFMEFRCNRVSSLNNNILEPPSQCQGRTFLVALVISPLYDRQTRDVIRTTWGKAVKERRWPRGDVMKVDVEVFFVLGMPKDIYSTVDASPTNSTHSPTMARESEPFSSLLLFENSAIDSSSSSKLAKSIREEARLHNDLIVGDFVDSYNNLTRKTLTGLQWAVKRCRTAKFIMKVDQDTLVDFPRLTDFLLQHTELEEQRDPATLNGEVDVLTKPFNHDSMTRGEAQRMNSKIPSSGASITASQFQHTRPAQDFSQQTANRPLKTLWNSDQAPNRDVIRNAIIGLLNYNSVGLGRPFLPYPTYASGGCYLLTSEAAVKITRAASYYPLLDAEDVHVTGILAEAAGVERLHMRQLKFQKSNDDHPCHLVGKHDASGCRDNEIEEKSEHDGQNSKDKGGKAAVGGVMGSVNPRHSYYMDLTGLSRDKLQEAWNIMSSGLCFQNKWTRPWI